MTTQQIQKTINEEIMGEGNWLGTATELAPIRDALLEIALQLSIQNDTHKDSSAELVRIVDKLCSHIYMQTAAIQSLSGTMLGSR